MIEQYRVKLCYNAAGSGDWLNEQHAAGYKLHSIAQSQHPDGDFTTTIVVTHMTVEERINAAWEAAHFAEPVALAVPGAADIADIADIAEGQPQFFITRNGERLNGFYLFDDAHDECTAKQRDEPHSTFEVHRVGEIEPIVPGDDPFSDSYTPGRA